MDLIQVEFGQERVLTELYWQRSQNCPLRTGIYFAYAFIIALLLVGKKSGFSGKKTSNGDFVTEDR